MTDQELIQAIGQVVESKIEPLRKDIGELKNQVGQLEVRIDQLDVGVDKLETRVGQLENNVNGMRVYMDTEQKRTLNLLLEGQQALWDRFVPQEKFDPLEDRTQVLELTVKLHSQEIQELQLA